MLRVSNSHEPGPAFGRSPRGFTMVELMVTLTVIAIVALALTAVLMTANRGKTSTMNNIESAQAARSAMDMIADDLRSAGYGADQDATPPQQPIVYVDSTELILCENLQPYPDGTAPHAPPLAYNPTGSPKPAPLNGTAWQPPMKYRTGAELIRYTLDVNNDGQVNANDLTGNRIVAQLETRCASDNRAADQMRLVVQDAYKRLIAPAVEVDLRLELKTRADEEAISIFGRNLEQLLLAPPAGERVVIGLDPGFRTGVKVAALSKTGAVIGNVDRGQDRRGIFSRDFLRCPRAGRAGRQERPHRFRTRLRRA